MELRVVHAGKNNKKTILFFGTNFFEIIKQKALHALQQCELGSSGGLVAVVAVDFGDYKH